MRIWDIEPKYLSRNHLLGEHRELHAIWIILTTDKGGSYRNHPEVLRWKGKLLALFKRHKELVLEMENRGFKHKSNFFKSKLAEKWFSPDLMILSELAEIFGVNTIFINTIEEQKQILLKKDYEFYKKWGWE